MLNNNKSVPFHFVQEKGLSLRDEVNQGISRRIIGLTV